MNGFVPESKHLVNRRTSSGWDAYFVCKTLVLWYPDILNAGEVHADMRERRAAMEFLGCLQEYPADLQDIMILLAQHYGIHKATCALDNAIRKYCDEARPRRRRSDRHGDNRRRPDRLTA